VSKWWAVERFCDEAFRSLTGKLPLHTSFFGGVDFGSGWYVTEQKAFDVVEKKVLRVRIG
jgi:hypothetical protein